jgi:hypothetical protein
MWLQKREEHYGCNIHMETDFGKMKRISFTNIYSFC